MSAQLAPPSQAADGSTERLARATLEAQMAGLNRLAAVGIDMVENLGKLVAREAAAAEPNPAFDIPAICLAHHRADRAVRLSYVLQHTILDRLQALDRSAADKADAARRAAEALERQAQARAQAKDPVNIRKAQIGQVVTGILDDAYGDDVEGFNRCLGDANERLKDHELFDDVLSRPTSEIIAEICRLLGLDPNWEGLAFEAWAQEEQAGDQVGAPLRSPPPWTGPRPGIRGRLLTPKLEEPPSSPDPDEFPDDFEDEQAQGPPAPPAEVAQAPPPYIPPPDPDILPGYPIGLPGEYPPERPGRRPRPTPPPTNYTRGFI